MRAGEHCRGQEASRCLLRPLVVALIVVIVTQLKGVRQMRQHAGHAMLTGSRFVRACTEKKTKQKTPKDEQPPAAAQPCVRLTAPAAGLRKARTAAAKSAGPRQLDKDVSGAFQAPEGDPNSTELGDKYSAQAPQLRREGTRVLVPPQLQVRSQVTCVAMLQFHGSYRESHHMIAQNLICGLRYNQTIWPAAQLVSID
jgi:hypothetical protein